MRLRLSIILLLSILISPSLAVSKSPTLKQKIGQMIMMGFPDNELSEDAPIIKAIQAGVVGGVILFDYNFQTKTFDHNIQNPAQLRKLTQALQHAASIPLLISIDYEGGRVNRLKKEYGFPEVLSAAEIAKQGDAAAFNQAEIMAKTLQAAGINLDFAPVVDLNINPQNPVIGKIDRSFSDDPNTVTRFAGIFSHVFAKHHLLCAFKHFPGHGSSTGDSHLGFVDVTETWQPKELIPYEQLLSTQTSCPMVMIAHVTHHGLDPNDYPASLSEPIITQLLRHKLHFKGVVVADDLQMKAISDQYGTEKAVRLAINAGVDILIFGNQLVPTPEDPAKIVDMIYNDVMSGQIPKKRIEASWRRIMQLKHRYLNNQNTLKTS